MCELASVFEVAQRGEKLGTNLTIERLPVVQPLVGPQPVARVERLPTGTVRTDERLDLGVNTDVDLLAVRGEKGLAAAILGTLELVLTPVSLHVGSQVANGAVTPVTSLIVAPISAQNLTVRSLDCDSSMRWLSFFVLSIVFIITSVILFFNTLKFNQNTIFTVFPAGLFAGTTFVDLDHLQSGLTS